MLVVEIEATAPVGTITNHDRMYSTYLTMLVVEIEATAPDVRVHTQGDTT